MERTLAVWLMGCLSSIFTESCLPQFSCMYGVSLTRYRQWDLGSLSKAPDKSHRMTCSSSPLQSACFGSLFLPGSFLQFSWRPCCGLCSRSLLACAGCSCHTYPLGWGSVPAHLTSHFASESQVWSGGEDSKWASILLREPQPCMKQARTQPD